MSALTELLEMGSLGPVGAASLYRSVRVMALANNFPPPPGADSWDDDAVAEVAHEFLSGSKGLARMTELALRADDDRSFERLLDTAVLNHLRDLARRTDKGRLIRRMKDVMGSDARFKRAPLGSDWWMLANGPGVASEVPFTALLSTLHDVEVRVPRWTSEERNAPIADRESMIDLLETALQAAGGALTDTDLASLLSERLDARRSPLTVELEILEGVAEPATPGAEPSAIATARSEAIAIFNDLSDVARILMTVADLPVRDIGLAIGTGKTQAAEQRRRLFEHLRNTLAEADEAQTILTELNALCVAWVRSRTATGGSTSLEVRATEGGEKS